MDKITFENGTLVSPAKITIEGVDYIVTPAVYEGNTPFSAHIMNLLQSKIEKNVVAVSQTQPTTNEKIWIKMGENVEKEIYVKNDNGVFEKFVNVSELEKIDTGWVDMTQYINTTYFRARPNYSPKARRIGNVVYWQGEVYCHTSPNTNSIEILREIPTQFRSNYQHSVSGVHYMGDTEPYNIFTDGNAIINVSQKNNIAVQDEVFGYQLSNLSGYLVD